MDSMTINDLMWFVTLGAIALFVVTTAMTLARKMSGRPADWGLPVVGFLVAAGSIALPQMMRLGEKAGDQSAENQTPTPPTSEVESPPTSPAIDMPQVPEINVTLLALIAGVVAIAIAAIVAAVVRSGRRKDHRAQKTETARLWGEHVATLNKLKQQYIDFETDPWSAFRRPLLGDVSEPTTAAFHDAFAHAQDLHTDHQSTSRSIVDDFGAAVRAANRAWEVADQHAREVAVPTTSETERRRLRQAEGALLLAMDENTSAAERRVALARVEELIKGLTVMPRKARTVIVAELDHVQRAAIDS